MGECRNAYRVLVGRPEGKRSLGRPRRRWEDNIKMDLREVGYVDRDWIDLAQDRERWRTYVRATMNLRVPYKPFISDNAGEMSPGSNTESYPAFARIGLRENPGKNLNQITCPDRDSNPGHLVSQPDALTVTPQVWTPLKLNRSPLLQSIREIDIVEPYNKKLRGKNFMFFDSGVNDGRVLMFATDRNLELLDVSDTIFSDGKWTNLFVDIFERRAFLRRGLADIGLFRYSASSYDEGVMERRKILSSAGVGIQCGLVDKASARRAENLGSNPGAGENFFPFHYSFIVT
ncbi:hypothetical protein ANN_06029 [Periplaneta americana]|uniref:Uncharacterized protein n=1 Tax=Periplaneta americana TaxID=6978 RepID=A0ABQ8TCE8_PERAM|nr:hypothetical protein ANN_06029 [Periplaneta americana]